MIVVLLMEQRTVLLSSSAASSYYVPNLLSPRLAVQHPRLGLHTQNGASTISIPKFPWERIRHSYSPYPVLSFSLPVGESSGQVLPTRAPHQGSIRNGGTPALVDPLRIDCTARAKGKMPRMRCMI